MSHSFFEDIIDIFLVKRLKNPSLVELCWELSLLILLDDIEKFLIPLNKRFRDVLGSAPDNSKSSISLRCLSSSSYYFLRASAWALASASSRRSSLLS